MTVQCQEAMYKFMDSVIKELFVKMKLFRDYDVAQSGVATQSKLVKDIYNLASKQWH